MSSSFRLLGTVVAGSLSTIHVEYGAALRLKMDGGFLSLSPPALRSKGKAKARSRLSRHGPSQLPGDDPESPTKRRRGSFRNSREWSDSDSDSDDFSLRTVSGTGAGEKENRLQRFLDEKALQEGGRGRQTDERVISLRGTRVLPGSPPSPPARGLPPSLHAGLDFADEDEEFLSRASHTVAPDEYWREKERRESGRSGETASLAAHNWDMSPVHSTPTSPRRVRVTASSCRSPGASISNFSSPGASFSSPGANISDLPCPVAPGKDAAFKKRTEEAATAVRRAGVNITHLTSVEGNTDVSGFGTFRDIDGSGTPRDNIDIFWKHVHQSRYEGERDANREVSALRDAQSSVNVAGVGTVDFEGTTHNMDDGYASLKFKNLQLDASLESFFKIQKDEKFTGKLEVRVPLLHHFDDDQQTLVFRKLAGIEDAVTRLAHHTSSIAEETWEAVEGLGEAEEGKQRLYFTVPERAAVSRIVKQFTQVSQNDLGVAILVDDRKNGWDLTEQLKVYNESCPVAKKKLNMDFSANILPGGVSDEGYLIAYLFDLDDKMVSSVGSSW